MKNGRVNIGSIRRTEIVDAAAAVISEQGIQNLSLSEIEAKVGMSRGQLTYYFKTKDEILLAVFDRMLLLMCEQHGEGGPEHRFANMAWLDVVRHLLDMILQDPPAHPEFHALQYTFLSQISHREDFRCKLADLYEEWRRSMAEGLKRDVRKRQAIRPARPRAMATLVQAILHGLAMQKAADPDAIDSREIVQLCLEMLGSYLWNAEPRRKPITTRKPARQRRRINGKEVLHDRIRK
jgi:AcrR family transcriptional regulator